MKIWGVVCLLGFTSNLNARIMDVSDREEKPESGIVSRVEEDSDKAGEFEDKNVDFSSVLKEGNEDPMASQKEIDPPETYFIVNTTADQPSHPGGGVLTLDPNMVNKISIPPFPNAQPSWWKRWWNEVRGWFVDES